MDCRDKPGNDDGEMSAHLTYLNGLLRNFDPFSP